MENNADLKPKKVIPQERFDGFALSHVLISVVGFAAALLVGLVLFQRLEFVPFLAAAIVGDAVLLLLYAFAGAWKARKKQWGFPRRFREGLWAFLTPALVAWAWGALVVFSVDVVAWPLLMLEFWGSLVFAFPSFLMVYLALVFGWLDSGLFAICFCAFLAGGIPPLLFFLGSLWGSRK